MRSFNDKDRQKKAGRINLDTNPAQLSPEKLAILEQSVTSALHDGYLPCPTGWKIAKDLEVPKIAVGGVMDKIGARLTGCQLGFFKVNKTPYPAGTSTEYDDQNITGELNNLEKSGNLTCSSVFELAHRYEATPLEISQASSALGLKIRQCQLGCF